MKKGLLSFAVIVIVWVSIAFQCIAGKNKTEIPLYDTTVEKGIVLMELFTSQGCNSCPPADEVLGNYASAGDDHIIPIAYHVDYWNRLGWTDTFSKRKFTQRQEEYASKFELGSIYTPQLIINGQKELVGSDRSRIAALVNGFLKEASILTIKISSTVMAESKLVINYSVNKILTGSSINAVLILDSITTVIRAGENRGLELVNHNVVQDFSSSHLSGTIGNITLKIPYGKLKTGSSIVLFVQDEVNGKISGAVKVKL